MKEQASPLVGRLSLPSVQVILPLVGAERFGHVTAKIVTHNVILPT